MEKFVIIGAVAAGSKAAAKARRLKPDAQIDIYTDEIYVSYSACGLPYFIEGNFNDFNMLIARTPEEYEASNIHVHLKHKLTKILPDKKQVIVVNLDNNQELNVDYDKLLIGTGAKPFIPPIKNMNLKNVFTLRTLEDGVAIKEKLHNSKHATIVGGGYIGVELLEAFVKNGIKVTMVEYGSRIMSIFDDEIADIIKNHILENNGDKVKILNSDSVVELIGEGEVKGVKTKNGAEFETDMVIIATGIKPNVEIAKEAGIEIGETGTIKVNDRMQTNFEDIYAAGDCAEKRHIVSGKPIWVPLGSTATKEGRTAAINMCGGEDHFQGVSGSAVTRYFGLTMSITGLTEKQAVKLGYEPVSATITKLDKVGYLPEAQNITIKLIADKNTRKLLGAQGIGCGDVDKRVNTVASALIHSATIDQFFASDLTYSPPYSPSVDPLLTASEKLIGKLNKSSS